MEKVINFEDKNIKFVLLDKGTYLIDGNIVNVDSYNKSRIKVIDENNIRKVHNNSFIEYYLNIENDSKLSVIEYNNKRKELLEHKIYEDEYDEDGTWDSLENEFEYRKFEMIYKPIRKNIQTFSDPIKVEVVNTKYDSGNKFINNAYLNGDGKYDLFVYNQHDAWLNIVDECFKELGMEFNGDCHYVMTKNEKIWGNSTHNCIRYVTAFGSYIFSDEFKNPHTLKGTLDDMTSKYNYDKNKIRKIIKTKYNMHFGEVDEDKVNFKELINDLYLLRGNINSIESKKSTWSEQNRANKKVNEIINYLESRFK